MTVKEELELLAKDVEDTAKEAAEINRYNDKGEQRALLSIAARIRHAAARFT